MTIFAAGTIEVEPFDFRRPPWISRERRAVLDGAHELMVPGLERLLSAALGGATTVEIVAATQLGFGEWRRALTSPVVTYVVPLASDQGGDGLLHLEAPLAFGLVDRLLGGGGECADRSTPLTPLEQAVLADMLARYIAQWQAGYRELAPFTPGALRFESVAESLAIVARHERVFVVDAEITCDRVAGRMSWLLPASRIEGFVQGTAGITPPPPPTAEQLHAALERELRAAAVPIAVRLTGLRLTARDGAALRVGQVLASNHTFQGDVELHVNGRPRFRGALGRQQGHVGLRILERLEGAAPPSRLLRRTSD